MSDTSKTAKIIKSNITRHDVD